MPKKCQYCNAPLAAEDEDRTCGECAAGDAVAYVALRNDVDATELDAAIAQTVTLRGTR